MAGEIELTIRDGDPWWASPDVWPVPGSDPEGSPGTPIVGEPCYVWARVHNRGDDKARNATVHFYWSNPAVGFDRTTATRIGTGYVTVAGDETAEVLCLTPWVPEYVNEGHVCLLAEVFHDPLDPLPATEEFNVPADRHVAQRNISVLEVAEAMEGQFAFTFEIHNTERIPRIFTVTAEQVGFDEVEALDALFGPEFELPQEGEAENVGFVAGRCPTPDAIEDAEPRVTDLQLDAGRRTGFSLVGELAGGGALFNVVLQAEQRIEQNEPLGGLSVLVTEV